MLEIINNRYINCSDDDCQYQSSCAQHHTAGDFRSEDGFTPNLRLNNDRLTCLSKNEPSNGDKYSPAPVSAVDVGMLCIKKGKLSHYNPWDED